MYNLPATMQTCLRRIYLVDDDESLLRTLGGLLRLEGFDVLPFKSPTGFLESLGQPMAGCVIADLKFPEMSGMEMYDMMDRAGCILPVIFLTGQGAIPDSVLAIKRGAVNFLTKPAAKSELLAAVDEAFRIYQAKQREHSEKSELRRRFGSLTPREKDVCVRVTEGLLNKQIAGDLGITEKTIKVHRARVMEKMAAHSVAALVRMVERVN